mgnify:CR=1 FL=1
MSDELGTILSQFIFKQLASELVSQGHKLTGSLIKSFELETEKQAEKVSYSFLMLNYGLSLEYGIKPNKIPYSVLPRNRGGTSKYIEGLIRFARIKFRADKRRAKQIAFAIARKHKKEGYPLTKKIGFISNVLEADKEQIQQIISDHYQATIELLIKEFLTFKQKK